MRIFAVQKSAIDVKKYAHTEFPRGLKISKCLVLMTWHVENVQISQKSPPLAVALARGGRMFRTGAKKVTYRYSSSRQVSRTDTAFFKTPLRAVLESERNGDVQPLPFIYVTESVLLARGGRMFRTGAKKVTYRYSSSRQVQIPRFLRQLSSCLQNIHFTSNLSE
jgi:hypothetical protein